MKSNCLLSARGLMAGYGDRILFRDLSLSMERKKVALVGRNGVGKSTLLRVLAKHAPAQAGRVHHHQSLYLVEQELLPELRSPGEERRRRLEEAFAGDYSLLLLDEPSQDLDGNSLSWLRRQLQNYSGGVLLSTHRPGLLRDFRHFFILAESGARYFEGSCSELETFLSERFQSEQSLYLRALNRISREEEKGHRLARRRARKELYGRGSELDRATPRSTLNAKRDYAQKSHGRINRRREERLNKIRDLARAARGGLGVELKMDLVLPELGPESREPVLEANRLEVVSTDGRLVVQDLDLSLGRQRVAICGRNGTGKTTLLKTLVGERPYSQGSLRLRADRLGIIHQGATNWCRQESLLELLLRQLEQSEVLERLLAAEFPLALAHRPLRSLSPGERVRAALLYLLSGQAPPELLVLDEPTNGLDIVGRIGLLKLLKSWHGGLLLVTHDRELIGELNCSREIDLSVLSV